MEEDNKHKYTNFIAIKRQKKIIDKSIAAHKHNERIKEEQKQQNQREMLYHWLNAAPQGDVDAQYHLGMAYSSGIGVPRDLREAIKWYTMGAKQGDLMCQTELDGYRLMNPELFPDEANDDEFSEEPSFRK